MAGTLTPTGLMQKWNAATLSWNTLFQEVLSGTETQWQNFATEMPSDTREEDYAWLDRIPAMREWIGARYVNSPSIRMQTLVNKLFEDTIGVPRTAMEDDKIGVYRPLMEELSRQAAVWPDTMVSEAMIAGTSAVVYDNQYYFDTDHPVNMDDASIKDLAGSATQSNLLTSSALSAENLKTAISRMGGFVGADGRPMRLQATTLVVPTALQFTAREILNNQFIAKDLLLTGGQRGATVTENVMRGTLDLQVWPFLDAEPNNWYVLCNNRGFKPFIFQQRMAPEFVVLTRPDDHNVFNFDEFLYGTRCRGVAGYGPWFLAIKGVA